MYENRFDSIEFHYKSNEDKELATLVTYFLVDASAGCDLATNDESTFDRLLNEMIANFEKLLPCLDTASKQRIREKLQFYERFLSDDTTYNEV